MAPDPSLPDVHPWLKTLPLAPEYHPTLAEFQDPIAYILKIEKEASHFGICKIVPPVPAAPKKTVITNFNRSFAARSPEKTPTFTTRQQQIGFCPRKPRPMQKPVWQSGDSYTLSRFEVKAKQFEKSQLKKAGKKSLSPLEIETLFWRACADKPFAVDYANDIPGSGFAPLSSSGKHWRDDEPENVGESAWNMRGVSRAKGSLLRFMKEDIPGVTSPMIYVAMMFSWFAWHVEDHELHSMNYLHTGSGKTWYGVPRDASLAFEDVVRVHGYCEEVNPLVTFAILGEKTTVMSPEVLINGGIPCCRLVQNAGEFVVTFPGAYHLGFSHGFNCGEAANIATPEWLKVAKDAAIRRASTNYPPMVSHFQLLYALALSMCSRVPINSINEPRSSRLKCKMKGEGEAMVKGIFVENVIQNNSLLDVLLDKGSSCIVLPRNASENPLSSGSLARSQIMVKPRLSLGLSSREEALQASEFLFSDVPVRGRKLLNGFCPEKGVSVYVQENELPPAKKAKSSKVGSANLCSSTPGMEIVDSEKESMLRGDGLLDRGLLSCVTCGILSFSCVAVIQPREAAARYLMSADCSFLKDQINDSGEINDARNFLNSKIQNKQLVIASGQLQRDVKDRMNDNLIHCIDQFTESSDQNIELVSDTAIQKDISALDLLASAYGHSSDSEGEASDDMPDFSERHGLGDVSLECKPNQQLHSAISSGKPCSSDTSSYESDIQLVEADGQNGATVMSINQSKIVSESQMHDQLSCLIDAAANLHALTSCGTKESSRLKMNFLSGNESRIPEILASGNLYGGRKMGASSSLAKSMEDNDSSDGSSEEIDSSNNCNETGTCQRGVKLEGTVSASADTFTCPESCYDRVALTRNASFVVQQKMLDTSVKDSMMSVVQTADKDSSRMHVFCLEHALEVEKQLNPVGGVHIMLLCHPEYPKIEAEAKLLANELGLDHPWKTIPYKEASKEDQKRIMSTLEDEETIPMNIDWAVKMGINLYFSASLSKTSIYSKQLPYNAVIYRLFVKNYGGSSPVEPKSRGRRTGRQKKIVVAGRWCGKVWMSNQVHPYLTRRNDQDEEHLVSQHSQGNCQKSIAEAETDTEENDDLVRSPERNSAEANNAATRKSGKKRKLLLLRSSRKKSRCDEIDSSGSIQDEAENTSREGGRVLRSSLNKQNATSNHNRILTWKRSSRDEAEGAPNSRLRRQKLKSKEVKVKPSPKKQPVNKTKKAQATKYEVEDEEAEYPCDMEGCTMSFNTKQDLGLHKRNICPVKGCGKKFFSHKYLVQHQKVHRDDRPLKCPWKGCKMTFKWPWARTEHIRVHTGDRPYICGEAGCGQTFRFVSDFSRHKRKTGHSVKKFRK